MQYDLLLYQCDFCDTKSVIFFFWVIFAGFDLKGVYFICRRGKYLFPLYSFTAWLYLKFRLFLKHYWALFICSLFLVKYYYFISIPFFSEVENCLSLRAEFILSHAAICRPGVESKPSISNSFWSQWRKMGTFGVICLWNVLGCEGFHTENISIWCRVSKWLCLSTYQTVAKRKWDEHPCECQSIFGTMSMGWQRAYEKAVFDRMKCDTVWHSVDLRSQFPISGRRTLLLSGRNSRKSCIICCLVNMPWITVSLLFCFYWPCLLVF